MKRCLDELHTKTHMLNYYISTITNVFLNQKRVNILSDQVCAFRPEISSFFQLEFPLSFPIFCVISTSVLSFPREHVHCDR
jgi:hypothetical protein